MTRFPYDQFAKDYLEELLQPLGSVQVPRRVAGEVREIDVWFAPKTSLPARFGELDEQLSAIIEPVLSLTPKDLTSLLLQLSQLSREELLAKFAEQPS